MFPEMTSKETLKLIRRKTNLTKRISGQQFFPCYLANHVIETKQTGCELECGMLYVADGSCQSEPADADQAKTGSYSSE
jgi:hypothetical protein